MKKLTPCFVLYALITFHIVNTRMLKINECGIYDAEFSIRKKNHRFDNNITKITNNVNLRECVTYIHIVFQLITIEMKALVSL